MNRVAGTKLGRYKIRSKIGAGGMGEQAFVDALVAAGKKFEMMSYPMRKHGITDDAATLHLYRMMLDFWKASL